MSKFIDKLNRISKGEPPPMGFRAQQSAAPKPKIQIIASLPAENAEALAGRTAGADAGLLTISAIPAGAEVLQKLAKAQPDVIWGARLSAGGKDDISRLTKAGADFITFTVSSPVTILENAGGAGKILEMESSIEDSAFRAANELAVDAVFVDGTDQPLTLLELMRLQRFSGMLAKPLLAPAPAQTTAEELKALWQAGVLGVVVALTAKTPEDALIKLRADIDKLDFPPRSKPASAIVPRITRPGRSRQDEEEDE